MWYQKKPAFHLIHHTFATTITLTNDIPVETVFKLLDHKSINILSGFSNALRNI